MQKSDTICLVFAKMKFYRPLYVTNYCTLIKCNRHICTPEGQNTQS